MTKTNSSATRNIDFKLLPIRKEYGNIVNNIYYVIENNESSAMENFQNLTKDQQDFTKDLISRMATNKDFKSPYINHHLKGYNYGEITPWAHRFFFFIKQNNIIFFDYVGKKKNKLKDSIYKNINRKKENYEKEFEEYLKRH